jgi:serine protease Do
VTQVTIALRRNALLARWLIALPLLLAALMLASAAQARTPTESFADLVDTLLPTVVNISTTQTVEQGQGSEEFEEFFREFFERRGDRPRPRRQNSLGSGFIIDPSGYIVTNHHVIAEADEITVRLHDGRTLDAEVIGSDEKTDLALLRVESDEPLAAAKWGDSDL